MTISCFISFGKLIEIFYITHHVDIYFFCLR